MAKSKNSGESKSNKASSDANSEMNKKGNDSQNSKTNQKDDPQKPTITEIFAMMNKSTKEFNLSRSLITELETEIDTLKKQKERLQETVKPIRRMERKFNPDGIVMVSCPTHDRKGIRHEIRVLTNQLILKEDQLMSKKNELAAYSNQISIDMKKAELVNKAQSRQWTKRNRWSIEARIVKTLNKLRSEDIKGLRELATLAKSKAANSKITFNNALQTTLDEYDPETSILCSYELRSVMYEAIRTSLMEWDNRKAPEFSKLKFTDQ